MTPRQIKILDAVREMLAVGGYSPTYRELAAVMDCAVSKAFEAADALVRSGHLAREPGSRGLRLAGRVDLRAVPSDELRGEIARRGETLGALSVRDKTFYGRGRPCAADSCGAEVNLGQLFCRIHWFALSRELQDGIKHAFARRDVDRYQALVSEARDLIDSGAWRRTELRRA